MLRRLHLDPTFSDHRNYLCLCQVFRTLRLPLVLREQLVVSNRWGLSRYGGCVTGKRRLVFFFGYGGTRRHTAGPNSAGRVPAAAGTAARTRLPSHGHNLAS
jgi:hypothetical protein